MPKWQVVASRTKSDADPENWIDKAVRLTMNRTFSYVVSGFSRTSHRPSGRQAVAVTVDGMDVLGVVRVFFDLSPQTTDRIVHGASRRLLRKAPDFTQEFAARHDRPFSFRQVREDVELAA